jgi:hypothetical protein
MVELEAIPPYSFELTLRKPAGWYWSTPQEIFEKDTCWSVTRFNKALLGLKLHSTGISENRRFIAQFIPTQK